MPGATDLWALSADELIRPLQAYNITPRKCLGYRTPAELFSNQVLHLKCESKVLIGLQRVWNDWLFQVILALWRHRRGPRYSFDAVPRQNVFFHKPPLLFHELNLLLFLQVLDVGSH